MNREAVALGTPVWSMFAGKLGSVDAELIVVRGRMGLLTRSRTSTAWTSGASQRCATDLHQ